MTWMVQVYGTIDVPDEIQDDAAVEEYISNHMNEIQLTTEYEYGTEEDFNSLN